MSKQARAAFRYTLLLVFGVVCWYLLHTARNLPIGEQPYGTRSTMYATLALLALAAALLPIRRRALRINRTDLFAALLFAGVTISRFALTVRPAG